MEYSEIMKYADVVYRSRLLKNKQIDKRVEANVLELTQNILELFEISTIKEEFIDSILIFEDEGHLGFSMWIGSKRCASNGVGSEFWRASVDDALIDNLQKIINITYDIRVLKKLVDIFNKLEVFHANMVPINVMTEGVEIFIGVREDK